MNRLPVTDQELMLYVDGELDDDRVADVEAEIKRSQHARDVLISLGQAGALVRSVADARAQAAGADTIVDDVMARIAAETAGNVVELRSRAKGAVQETSSASARTTVWYALGGLAAAAAVALVIWRIAGADLAPQAHNDLPPPHTAETAGTEVASTGIPAPDYDPEPSVSVDAVDFGARTGTIFYVPADTGTTTIVWLSDDESGGM